MMLGRRAAIVAGIATLGSAAWGRPPTGLWFDPTQLPSFSGRLARWLINPAGELDRALFREGAQVIFPPSEAQALTAAIADGASLTVWGIRARTAPVIIMLAWSREGATPQFVERPSWFASTARGTERLTLTGKIAAPLLTPQGDPMGVILEDGAVIRLATEWMNAEPARFANGREIAAQGLGTRNGARAALDAERLGEKADAMQDVPESYR
ncbi:hypothetical protein J4558_04970 [Leptolyngbya sp. 15MV]|nr:hypothetical protein J4558_04970 [Leptolyngbya sp. 15MV]